VHLVDVDVVGAQASQRVRELLLDPRAARVPDRITASPPIESDLGGQHHAIALAPALQGLPDDLLGCALTVDGSRIDQRDAGVERGTDRPDRALLVRAAPHPAAHPPGSEADAGGLRGDAFDRDMFHSTSSLHPSGLRSPSGAGSALMAEGSTRCSAMNHTCFSL